MCTIQSNLQKDIQFLSIQNPLQKTSSPYIRSTCRLYQSILQPFYEEGPKYVHYYVKMIQNMCSGE